MMGTLIDYWHSTGDDSYNDMVKQALIHQAGEDRDYLPANQTAQMGNDDQGFWAMTAMLAAEYVFPDPPEDAGLSWLAGVQAVFNAMVSRWDEKDCNGGLRWQVFDFNNGWSYKNSVSNGCFFNIAARLARYTDNSTYAEWAGKIWDWEVEMGLISEDYRLRDGVTIREGQKCQDDRDNNEWSYNSGVWLYGAAILADYSDDPKWDERMNGILDHGLKKFSKNDYVFEPICEGFDTCDDDQRSFKGYYLRWLGNVANLHENLKDKIRPFLKRSAEAAGKACSGTPTKPMPEHPVMFGGHPNTACGMKWEVGYDDTHGVPEQMNGVAAFLAPLDADKPKSAKSGGTSKSDPGAGASDEEKTRIFNPITTGDRVGAGFLTTIILCGIIGGSAFLIV